MSAQKKRLGHVDSLFTVENSLREAAINYTDWLRSTNPNLTYSEKRKRLEEARRSLRLAAANYASWVKEIEI